MVTAVVMIQDEVNRPQNPFLEAVGKRVRRAREARGLSQKELGDLTGVTQTQISNYELGLSNMKIDTLRLIALATDADPCELLGERRR